MKAPDKCPKCGAGAMLYGTGITFKCLTWMAINPHAVEESRECISTQRDRLVARVKRLEEAGARMYPHFAKRDTPHKKALADEWEEAIR